MFTANTVFYKPQLYRVAVEPLDDLDSITSTINVHLGVDQFSVVEKPIGSMRFVIHKLTLTFELTFEVLHFFVQLVILHSISRKSLFARCLLGLVVCVNLATAGVDRCLFDWYLSFEIFELFIQLGVGFLPSFLVGNTVIVVCLKNSGVAPHLFLPCLCFLCGAMSKLIIDNLFLAVDGISLLS